MTTKEDRNTALAFARALDADAFDKASRLVADDCTYEIRGRTLDGRAAILASYADASEKARRSFDSVRYESEVEATQDGHARVLYVDVLRHAGEEHRHRCAQDLTFGADGRIVRIVHEDLPGEREALAAFMARVGVACSED